MSFGRKQLLDKLPSNAICVEVGVWRGGFSDKIYNYKKPQHLYLVDPWLIDQDNIEGKAVNRHSFIANRSKVKTQADMDTMHLSVVERYIGNEHVTVLRKKSVEAAEIFQNETLDWVYIDGCHDYEFVLADLEAWYPKIRPEGFLCGDDFKWQHTKDGLTVKKAVEKFAHDHELKVQVVPNNQFLMRKHSVSNIET